MAEKKRKRNEDGAERPSKKAAVTPQGNVKVELLQEETLGPLLGKSQRAPLSACVVCTERIATYRAAGPALLLVEARP